MDSKPKRVKTGGRTKGTPNKTTAFTKDIITSLLDTYSRDGSMSEDFASLEPKDRLLIAEKLMNYVVPKMQSQQVDINSSQGDITIEARLRELSGETDE